MRRRFWAKCLEKKITYFPSILEYEMPALSRWNATISNMLVHWDTTILNNNNNNTWNVTENRESENGRLVLLYLFSGGLPPNALMLASSLRTVEIYKKYSSQLYIDIRYHQNSSTLNLGADLILGKSSWNLTLQQTNIRLSSTEHVRTYIQKALFARNFSTNLPLLHKDNLS